MAKAHPPPVRALVRVMNQPRHCGRPLCLERFDASTRLTWRSVEAVWRCSGCGLEGYALAFDGGAVALDALLEIPGIPARSRWEWW